MIHLKHTLELVPPMKAVLETCESVLLKAYFKVQVEFCYFLYIPKVFTLLYDARALHFLSQNDRKTLVPFK